jgi:hypothetical protein
MLASRTTTWSVDAACPISGVGLGRAAAVQVGNTTAEGVGDCAVIVLGPDASCGLIVGAVVATGVTLGADLATGVAVAVGRATAADGPTVSWQPHTSGSRHKANRIGGETNSRFIAERDRAYGYVFHLSTAGASRTRGEKSQRLQSLKLLELPQLIPHWPGVCAIMGPNGSSEVWASKSGTQWLSLSTFMSTPSIPSSTA